MAASIGFRPGRLHDSERPDWDGIGKRPVSWAAWYPAAAGAVEEQPREPSWFLRPPLASGAPLATTASKWPLVLLSHGTGGVFFGLEWLACDLARRGMIVVAPNHHGNTGAEPYRPEGFLCLWERAPDLSVLLDLILAHPEFGERIDTDAVFAAGFSAGAYAVMLLAGARVRTSQFGADNPRPSLTRGPREFPDLAEHIPRLLETSPVFRQSWERMRESYRDKRIKAVLACAPGRSVLGFDESSLQGVDVPVGMVVGDADRVAPAQECSAWLHHHVPTSSLTIVDGGWGHYAFLPNPSALGLQEAPDLFADPPLSGGRSAFHAHVGRIAAQLFALS